MLKSSEIKIRKACEADEIFLLHLRNNKNARAMFRNQSCVQAESHSDWFRNMLASSECVILIIESGKFRIGMCRFDYLKDMAQFETSIIIDESYRHMGFGGRGLHLAHEFQKLAGPASYVATVRRSNYASLRLFQRCGYKVRRLDEVFAYLELLSN